MSRTGTDAGANDDGPKGSLDRGLAILTHLSTGGDATVADLAGVAGMSRSAAYRLVDHLRAADYVTDSDAGRITLGPAAARMAMAAMRSVDVIHVAPELLRLLGQQTRETVGLAVPTGEEMVFVYRERGPQTVTMSVEPGARRPLHCTSVGKAYLSALPERERHEIIAGLDLAAVTEHSITDRDELENDVALARDRGWAIERGEFADNGICCGSPVLDHTGRPVAAISVAGLGDRMVKVLDRVGPVVASTAEAISRRLGYNPDPV